MERRRGIGATVAAAVIFSVLLAANLAVYTAAVNRERLYRTSNAEDSMRVALSVLTAAGGMDALIAVQRVVSAAPLPCDGALSAVAARVSGVDAQQASSGVSVVVVPSVWYGPPAPDNLTAVAPFDGADIGALNLVLAVAAQGNDSADGVSLSRSETHLVHLPARFPAESSFCVEAALSVAEAVGRARPMDCTPDALAPAMQSAAREVSTAAVQRGFRASLGYSLLTHPDCAVSFLLTLTQPGVQGPEGPFSLVMELRAQAQVALPAPGGPGRTGQRTAL